MSEANAHTYMTFDKGKKPEKNPASFNQHAAWFSDYTPDFFHEMMSGSKTGKCLK